MTDYIFYPFGYHPFDATSQRNMGLLSSATATQDTWIYYVFAYFKFSIMICLI
ncbi:hypothetical protein BDV38DRAFT_39714 [Aspergillus pseudotamarii]|uniref:Uncharacterized protein n=1 Tax=Aspergillus pseudotamarii TaxID=132259 RepID=A0A5N6SYG2_ASPPS|nr:uncharacterized protein BDV38DRAFT_39714 [Aspergillus pseudotamarii]KAE8139718.1 hypothetical protein BDV38DRAFT_39714 [Aspergillus pseudotamarii]